MCGIFGIASAATYEHKEFQKYKYFMETASVFSTVRGVDSTGLGLVSRTNMNPIVIKKPYPAWDFNQIGPVIQAYNNIEKLYAIIGHVRSATRGAKTYANAHPFQHGHITLVHNGTLITTKSLEVGEHFDTDSEYICKALSQNDDYIKVLEKIDGAFALVWYNDKTKRLHFARNSERDLHVAKLKGANSMAFMSEAGMLEYTLGRAGIEVEEEVYFVGENTCLNFDVKHPKEWTIDKFKPFEYPKVTQIETHNRWQNQHSRPTQSDRLILVTDPKDIAALGIDVPNPVLFFPRQLVLPKQKSRSGIVIGGMVQLPHATVQAANCDERKVFGSKHFLTGRFVGIDVRGETPIIVLKDIKEFPQQDRPTYVLEPKKIYEDRKLDWDRATDKEVEAFKKKGPTCFPVQAGGDRNAEFNRNFMTELERVRELGEQAAQTKFGDLEDDSWMDLCFVPSPTGARIPMRAFASLAKGGCGYCAQDLVAIARKTPSKIKWIDDCPMCESCHMVFMTTGTVPLKTRH